MNQYNFPKRLSEIRELAKLSQTALAKRMEVSPSLVSHWESGVRSPSESQVMDIARALGVSMDYLMNSEVRPRFQFRGQTPPTDELQAQVDHVLKEASEQIYFIDYVFRSAGKNLKPFGLKADFNQDQLVNMASQFREALRLNRRVSLDELKGALAEWNVFVFEWALPDNISGLSYRGSTTVIIINSQHNQERKLFTLAHEFAHVLFHLGREQETAVSVIASKRDPMEKQANQFAAELLMPTAEIDQMLKDYGDTLRQPITLAMAAKSFNVSVQAMFYRLVGRGTFRWDQQKKYINFQPEEKPLPDFRVSKLETEISKEYLQTAISLHESGKASAGKLAEWFFTSRGKIEDYLANLGWEVESGLTEA